MSSSLNKIESFQKRAPRFLYKNYSIPYEGLIEKSGKVKMSANRLKNLCVEICKTINKLNPKFINNIFKVEENKRLGSKRAIQIKSWNSWMEPGYF